LDLREEVTGGWRKWHNEKVHSSNSSPDIIRLVTLRRMRWMDHVARIREIRNANKILVRKSEEKKPAGKTCRRWKDTTKMNLN
jgi:hypothetical protein